ncbi:MAG TPA: DUF6265 family protein [Novosphingobium sp.]|nr:DUF6265 family protein [Novosphingobium sp.]
MRRLLAFPLALVLVAAPLPAQEQGLPGWLAGAWSMESGARWADETWTSPRGGMMMGASRSGFGPELAEWEQVRIQRRADGGISLFAQPQGRAATEFRMATQSETAIEFANPAHDYPQRIRYERVGQLLIAEVSKMDGSEAMRWQYRRVAD